MGLGSGRDEAILWSTLLLLTSQDNPEAFVSEWRAEMKDRRWGMKIRSGGKTPGRENATPDKGSVRAGDVQAAPTIPGRADVAGENAGVVRGEAIAVGIGADHASHGIGQASELSFRSPPSACRRAAAAPRSIPASLAPSHRRTDHGATRALRRAHLGTGRVGRGLHRVHDRRGGEARGRDHRPQRQQRRSDGGSTFDLKARNGMPVRFEGLRLVVSHVKSK